LMPYMREIDANKIYSNHGPLTVRLTERLARVAGLAAGQVALCSTGTSALSGAILAMTGPAKPGRDLALVPAFTFIATAAAAEECGYVVEPVDVSPATLTLDPVELLNHPKLARVGVVMPVAALGRAVPQREWQEFSVRTGIAVVIDGAASLPGACSMPEKFFGPLPVAFSFHATKSFATGEGGAVAVTDQILCDRIAQCLNFGFWGSRDSQTPSTNGKMSEYHAAVGLAELDVWKRKLSRYADTADLYRQEFSRVALADRLLTEPDIAPNYIVFQSRDAREAGAVETSLTESEVPFRRWYGLGIHRHTYYKAHADRRFPVTDDVAYRLLGLPVGASLNRSEIAMIVEAIASGMEKAGSGPGALHDGTGEM
jgi:dTDP-4-amino-4,6-dideoxygalactose transaminase